MAGFLIVIVEDDKDLNSGLCKALKSEDRTIVSCAALNEAREQIFLSPPDLVMLDINLPDGNGLDLLKEIKESGLSVPVILLSANDTDADVVKGLELGADDYVTKPFSLSVLRARVNTQLRKAENREPKSDVVAIDQYAFDFDKMVFTAGGLEVSLSKTEQRLLKMLVSNRGITLGREELIDRLWTDGAEYVDENALSVAIKRLRDKLEAKDYIKTIYGLGYQWVKKDES
ncbi:MAG: response regulator transcription factor [Lachnospiraceae bacterium]|nr:response regulator transcription factor [Lachnospiraceae bacterium]